MDFDEKEGDERNGRRIDVEATDDDRRIARETGDIPSYSRAKSIKWGS